MSPRTEPPAERAAQQAPDISQAHARILTAAAEVLTTVSPLVLDKLARKRAQGEGMPRTMVDPAYLLALCEVLEQEHPGLLRTLRRKSCCPYCGSGRWERHRRDIPHPPSTPRPNRTNTS